MTTLPSLPTNLNPNSVGKSVANVIQNATPQFPNLPKIPTVNLTNSTPTFKLIETTLPESEIDKLIEKYRLPDGTVNLDDVNEELNNKYDKINKGYEAIINGLQVPPIQLTGILSALIPTIPVPVIPSPAEIRDYINDIIEKKKIAQQQAIINTQRLAAKEEESPFTARQNEEQLNKVESVCITTETGSSEEDAVSKAELRLRRSQQCSGNTTVLNSTEQNGIFIVTVKID